MAKYLVVNENTGSVVLVDEATARSEGYRHVEPSERLLYQISKDIGSIKSVTNIIGLLIIIGVVLSIIGSCGF